jgi:hypothetical protein
MWCPTCRADVAAELSADHHRFLCARCQTEIGQAAGHRPPLTPHPVETERDARELLARWSTQSLLEPRSQPQPAVESVLMAETPPQAPRRVRRLVRRPAEETQPPPPPEPIPRSVADPARTGHWLSAVGHLAAYAGIGLLTCGTVLVILSHFGGPTSYAPTGWLVSTLGQMLLLLGVVTLVSAGMDETRADVARHIERLDERLRRYEAGHGPAAPHPRSPAGRRQRRSRAA